MAHAFYEAGSKVILAARRLNELERVKSDLMSLQVNHQNEPFILELDLAHIQQLPTKAMEAINHFGNIDILINNGGISYRGSIKDTDIHVDQNVMKVNYFGQIALTKGDPSS